MPKLRMHTYAGDSRVVAEGEMPAIRAAAAAAIRCHRTKFGYPVTELEEGRKWELESDPDGAHLVSDHEGILEIVENPPCCFCGNEVDDDPYTNKYEPAIEDLVFCDADCANRYIEADAQEDVDPDAEE